MMSVDDIEALAHEFLQEYLNHFRGSREDVHVLAIIKLATMCNVSLVAIEGQPQALRHMEHMLDYVKTEWSVNTFTRHRVQ